MIFLESYIKLYSFLVLRLGGTLIITLLINSIYFFILLSEDRIINSRNGLLVWPDSGHRFRSIWDACDILDHILMCQKTK